MVLDILILVVIGSGLVIGYLRGAVAQLAVVVGVVAGIIVARLYGGRVTLFFAGGEAPSALDYAAGYAVAFIAAYLLGWVIVKLFNKVLHKAGLGIFNRIAGAVFKAAIFALVLSIFLNIYLLIAGNTHELDHPKKPWRAMIVRFAPAALGYLNK